ncbi:DUF4383 domain-containing protein [Dermatobacter hominis]|uniref:DUF4383 domain-containing protein n=1 Tax=Dermatobacter hominis TaxID=2884263 RepID=UPI001D11234C|nr:DUF4383 domain-containing protein [Dermatobacter hominis]UDY37511.1 DUF4383 domain-containing protein [Dermatobacter hominis]
MTAAHRVTRSRETTHTPLQIAALAVGITFLAVGIAGFVPGLTSDLDQIEFAGHESGAQLLGLFQVSVLHNLVHVLFGIVGIAAWRRTDWARRFLLIGGAVYLLLFVYGLVVDRHADANFVPLDDADNWLHLGLGAGMIALGALLPGRTALDADGRRTPGEVR